MKKLVGIAALLLLLSGCNGTAKKTESTESSSTTAVSSSTKKSSTSPSREESSSTKELAIAKSAPVEPSLADFVGGWGVPNSGNIFYVNVNGTISTPLIGEGLITSTPDSIEFSRTSDGRPLMVTTLNGVRQETIKEADGSLTSNGKNFQPYDKPIETFQNNDEVQNQESPVPEEEAEVYTEVLAGEGPRQVAERNGITLEKLYELNGMDDENGVMPGQSLRVK